MNTIRNTRHSAAPAPESRRCGNPITRLTQTRLSALCCAAALILVPAFGVGAYVIDWWTVDGGGDMRCTGGNYELSGTIGQHDAGTPMTGGNYELTGGFWAGAAEEPSDRVPSLIDLLSELDPDGEGQSIPPPP